MPSANATRFDLSVYVEPEYVERFRKLLEDESESCLQLDMERVIGAHLAGEVRTNRLASMFISHDYGADVAEVFVEGEN